jgi:ribonuclease HI
MRRTNQLFKHPGPFTLLTTNHIVRSPHIAIVQTDGSYSFNHVNMSRTAVVLNQADGKKNSLCKTYFTHANSCEAEWCSVLDGVIYSLRRKADNVNLENDNIGVINSLIRREKPTQIYKAYYEYILDLSKNFDSLAIRWIPRRLNKADRLFRV